MRGSVARLAQGSLARDRPVDGLAATARGVARPGHGTAARRLRRCVHRAGARALPRRQSGRIDVAWGATVIELKTDLRREARDVIARMPAYLADASRGSAPGRTTVGLATDGATLLAYTLDRGTLVQIGRYDVEVDHPERLLNWLEPLLSPVFATPWDIRMGSLCRGMPRQRRAAPAQAEFPDVKLRYLSEEGPALGRCRAPVLRAARLAGQLSGGGRAVDRERDGKPADCIAALSAGSVGAGSRASPQGEDPGRCRLSDEAADRARSDPGCGRDRNAGRRDPRRCRLWHRWRLPVRPVRARARLCPGRAADIERLAAWRDAAAAQGLERNGPPAVADATSPRPQAALSQGPGAGTAGRCLAEHHMARRIEYRSRLALRRRARPARVPRLQSHHAARAGVAANRVARRRRRATRTLALHAFGGGAAARSRGHGQAARTHRARLSRAYIKGCSGGRRSPRPSLPAEIVRGAVSEYAGPAGRSVPGQHRCSSSSSCAASWPWRRSSTSGARRSPQHVAATGEAACPAAGAGGGRQAARPCWRSSGPASGSPWCRRAPGA